MKIVSVALFIMMFLSIMDGVVTNHLSQPTSDVSINNATTTQLIENRTMIQLQSNYYNSQYPVQVITFPMPSVDDVNSTQNFFRLRLPPTGYDDTLCTPPTSTMIDTERPNITSDIADSSYPTGLLIKADTKDNNCTLSNIVLNVIELNRMLPASEVIQYLIFPQDNNNISYMQIDTIINEATNNNISSDELFPTSSNNNITIVYMDASYVNEIMKAIQNDVMIKGCNPPFLLEQKSSTENITSCNFIYQLNETTIVNDATSSGEQSSAAPNPYLTLQAVYGYVYLTLAFFAFVGLLVACIYRRYHPILIIVPEQSASATMMIEKEKNPKKLTEKQFELLPETKYTLDLVEVLKKYGNNNIVTNTTVLLDEKPFCHETTSATTDFVFTNTTRIIDDAETRKLHTTIHLNNRESNTNLNEECGICCPICIEEFVVDEIVIVLPKCNHIYHKDCIKQWLRKKQGCCPYCKVVVIDDDVVNDNDAKNNNNNNSQGINDLEV